MLDEITFARLTQIAPSDIAAHMSDPRMATHMPLLTGSWDTHAAQRFVTAKEAFWTKDGLGHWAFLSNGRYVGWGGFQKEDGDWDYGLVLRPDAFGLGLRISRSCIAFAQADPRIPFVTFLLPPTRKHLGALTRLGARYLHDVDHEGARFLKFRLDTS